ncbi:MAG: ArsR/SmtB family transcription factor, partial [Gemmatimonadota bacterium]
MIATDSEGVDELQVLDRSDQLAALLSPERRRLVGELRREPDSAAGLARRLGASRQRLNYHLRELENAGLLALKEERSRGNFTERVLEPTAGRFLVDPEALDPDPGDRAPAADRFSAAYLVALAARTIRELADLRERSGREGKR